MKKIYVILALMSSLTILYGQSNIGINTTAPEKTLHVINQLNNDGILIEGITTANNVTLGLKNTAKGGRQYIFQSTGGGSSIGEGKFALRDIDAGTTRLTIDSTGNVGIGFNDPVERLQVSGAIRFQGATGNNVGTVQWTGTDFQGYDGTSWKSFTRHILIADSDNDTRITTEEDPDEDTVRVFLKGIEGLSFELNQYDQPRIDFASSNVYLGRNAADALVTSGGSVGQENVVIGNNAARARTGGSFNVLIGTRVADNSGASDRNVIIGFEAGKSITNGSGNVVIGMDAGKNIGGGTNNVIIGNTAGFGYAVSNCVFIGKSAGQNESSSDKLYIDNTSTSSPLIYGDFTSDELVLNGDVDVEGVLRVNGPGSNEPVIKLDSDSLWVDNLAFRVSDDLTCTSDGNFNLGGPSYRWGTIYATNNVINTSDARLKQDIEQLGYGLAEVMKLSPVTYNWKNNSNYQKKIGFIAQDVMKVVPEAVYTHAAVYDEQAGSHTFVEMENLGMTYSDLIPVLVNAIKEQQVMIEELRREINSLKDR